MRIFSHSEPLSVKRSAIRVKVRAGSPWDVPGAPARCKTAPRPTTIESYRKPKASGAARMGKPHIGIDDFVERLRSFESSVITRDSILDFCDSVRISDSSLAAFVKFDDHFYTRNLIYRDPMFEIM